MKPARLSYVTTFKNHYVSSKCRGRTVVFSHIPKAAGTTLDHVFHDYASVTPQFGFHRALGTIYGQWLGDGKPEALAGLADAPRDRVQACSYVSGHVPFGGFDRFMDRPLYATVLRRPLPRCMSHYRHGLRRGGWCKGTPIAALFADGRLVDNAMTRQISGCADRKEPCDETMLKAALLNLENKYALVATTDSFGLMLKALLSCLGLPDILFEDRQISGHEGDAYDPPAADLEAITAHNEFDTVLFEHAAKREFPWCAGFFESPVPAPVSVDRFGDRVLFSAHSLSIGNRNRGVFPRASLDPYLPQLEKMGIPIEYF